MKKPKSIYSNSSMDITHPILFPANTSEDKYKAIIENSQHAFVLAIAGGATLETNPAATKIFGYTREEFKHLKRHDLIDETDPGFMQAMKLREKKGHVTVEAIGIRKNGERFPVEFSSAFFTGPNGELMVSTMLTDISERNKTKLAVEESEQRYKMFLKHSKEGIWRVELDKPMPVTTALEEMIANCYEHAYVVECNDNFAIMYGYANAAEMTGLPLKQLVPKENPINLEYLTSFFSNGFKVTEQVSYEYDKKGNQLVYVNNMVGIVEGDFIQSAWGIQRDITLQKKTETELLKAHELNELIARATNDAIWDWDITRNAIWGNSTYNFLIGVNDYESFIDRIHPDDREKLVSNFKSALERSATTITEEFRCKTTDGSYRNFYDRAHLLYDGSGKLYRMSGAMMDITERKKAEQALAESENHLRTIVSSDPECIKLLNYKGELLEINPAGLAMIEADHLEQVIGKNMIHFLVPGYLEAFTELFKDVFNGKSRKLEYEIIGLKGTQRSLETHAVPLRNTEGKIIALLSITRDITENKNAEALLLASEERYRYLFNHNPESIVIWDIDSLKIVEANETALELYGYSRNEFLQLTVLDIRTDDEHKRFLEIVQQARNNEFTKKTMTWRHIDHNGAVIIMEVSSHNIMYNGKKSVLALGKNVTEKIRLENSLAEERQVRHQQITDAVITGQEKERSQLGEELHDNINQILATTRLYIECGLSENNPRPDLVKESKILLEKAMFEIRKLSTTLLPPSLGEIGLLDALNDLAANFKEVNPLLIETDWDNFPEKLLHDKLKLTIYRIVQEQLNNVSKHAMANKVIIRLQKINDHICLELKDDGVGFNTAVKRNGLGLRNMISRAEVNNGNVHIESQPGAGCELRVVFSIAKSEIN